MTKLWTSVVILPRWFAAPAVVLTVLLGAWLGGATAFQTTLAVLAGLAAAAAAHCWNGYHDWAITGFDKGEEPARSSKKPYTMGQSAIATGLATEGQVLWTALAWGAAAILLGVYLAFSSTFLILIPIVVALLCAPWYSTAKKLWHPEIPLTLGFGPMATLLGYLAAGDASRWWVGILAGIPSGFLFGVVAEGWDQWIDSRSDWPKGGRSMGLWIGWTGRSISLWLSLGVVATMILQVLMINLDVLASETLWALAVLVLGGFFISYAEAKKTWAVMGGLGAIFLYSLVLYILQVLS